jgi:hypothetical protein
MEKIWRIADIGFIRSSTSLNHSFYPCKQLNTLNNFQAIMTCAWKSGRAQAHANGRM